jgi:hypothetical protein
MALRALLLISLGCAFCLPYAFLLIPTPHRSKPLTGITGLALSTGCLTLAMTWLGIFLKPYFSLTFLLAFIVVVLVGGLALLFSPASQGESGVRWRAEVAQHGGERPRGRTWGPARAILVCIGLILGLIFLKGLYYPFVDWDAIAIYGAVARRIYLVGGMDGLRVPRTEGYIASYPLLIPMTYVYTYMAWAGINEHLAKVIPALLAIVNVAATFYLGKAMFGQWVGLAAAFILSVTPLFAERGASGYADVPVAALFTLAVLYFYLLHKEGDIRHAVLAGLLTGLAIWAKNGALTLMGSIPLFYLFCLLLRWQGRSREPGRLRLWHVILILLLAFMIGGLWYVRNLALYGYVVPYLEFWIARADRSWLNFVPFLKSWGEFGYLLTPLYILGFFYTFLRLRVVNMPLQGTIRHENGVEALAGLDHCRLWLLRLKPLLRRAIFRAGQVSNLPASKKAPYDLRPIFLLTFSLPYLLLWWYNFSYDPRFLLTILPLFAVEAAWFLEEVVLARWQGQRVGEVVALLLVIATALSGLRSTGGPGVVRQLLLNPAATDEEKRAHYIGSGYRVYQYLRGIARESPQARILTTDGLMPAYEDDPAFVEGWPQGVSEVKGYTYFVLAPWAQGNYAQRGLADNEVLRSLGDPGLFEPVLEQGGYTVYRVRF